VAIGDLLITKRKIGNQQESLKEPSNSLHYTITNNQTSKSPRIYCITPYHTAHARALILGEWRRLFPLVPTAIGRVLVRVRVQTAHARALVFWREAPPFPSSFPQLSGKKIRSISSLNIEGVSHVIGAPTAVRGGDYHEIMDSVIEETGLGPRDGFEVRPRGTRLYS
jgi:hypothetical protein